MTVDPKIEEWTVWLEDHIIPEVSKLLWSSNIYAETRQIVINNPAINTGNHFYEWIDRNYVHTTLMGIRRQLDKRGKHSKVASLKSLLSDMKENYHLLTRKRYLELYSEEMQNVANKDYDNLAGESVNIFPVDKLEKYLNKLEDINNLHKTYIDKRLAHREEITTLNPMGTYQDLDDAIIIFKEITIRYYLLLSAKTIELFSPNRDWKNIFSQAWIAGTDDLDLK
ncbi:hypothetical protein APA_3261 [Pseudanabaena sp. lw0831]|uniref:AbiU2 domain-containing protein n=1 Tax=Pseudanabaena sp. lw0831 TaxID=1357935 RepID=UPI001915395F|nr:hypothetical protein [Pseudanabaena sp. lw0831]GBO55211.1 hypothetical protein APA_3261 [Pseudanabaena sp. lw0831]